MRVYATPQQLAVYLTGNPDAHAAQAPADAARLLGRASTLIDDYTLAALFTVDTDGYPTAPTIVDAFTAATCAQVEHWLTGDEEDDILGPVQGLAIGAMQEQYGAGTNRATPMYLAPRAARHLRQAGLLTAVVDSQ